MAGQKQGLKSLQIQRLARLYGPTMDNSLDQKLFMFYPKYH